MVTDNQKRHLDLLQETVDFYAADTGRRAVGEDGGCFYYEPRTGNRCAIGRILDLSLAQFLGDESKTIIDLIQEGTVELDYDTGFLRMLQTLHDEEYHWNDNSGLTEMGMEEVKRIQDYILKELP